MLQECFKHLRWSRLVCFEFFIRLLKELWGGRGQGIGLGLQESQTAIGLAAVDVQSVKCQSFWFRV